MAASVVAGVVLARRSTGDRLLYDLFTYSAQLAAWLLTGGLAWAVVARSHQGSLDASQLSAARRWLWPGGTLAAAAAALVTVTGVLVVPIGLILTLPIFGVVLQGGELLRRHGRHRLVDLLGCSRQVAFLAFVLLSDVWGGRALVEFGWVTVWWIAGAAVTLAQRRPVTSEQSAGLPPWWTLAVDGLLFPLPTWAPFAANAATVGALAWAGHQTQAAILAVACGTGEVVGQVARNHRQILFTTPHPTPEPQATRAVLRAGLALAVPVWLTAAALAPGILGSDYHHLWLPSGIVIAGALVGARTLVVTTLRQRATARAALPHLVMVLATILLALPAAAAGSAGLVASVLAATQLGTSAWYRHAQAAASPA